MILRTNLFFFFISGYAICSHHKYFLVALVDGVVINHADNGHTQVAPDAERDAESQAGQDGDDVPSGHAETGTVHHRKLLLLHQLRTPLCRQLDGLSIGLPLFNQPGDKKQRGFLAAAWNTSPFSYFSSHKVGDRLAHVK